MEFGTLAGNTFINGRIYALLGEIHASDVPRFARKFRRGSDEECFHTYRELILGSHIRARGYDLRYEQPLAGKTPDWTLIQDGRVAEILDVVTLHQCRATDVEISKAVSSERMWTGWVSTPPDRLFSKIQQKAEAYSTLAAEFQMPYLVGAFGEFTAPIEREEVHHVLNELHAGLFAMWTMLAGVIFFRERAGEYEYHHFRNPAAAFDSQLIGSL